jgi:hypothetical protein
MWHEDGILITDKVLILWIAGTVFVAFFAFIAGYDEGKRNKEFDGEKND